MTVFQALVLGIVQGLAEFLPISSSAHLALTPWVLGWQDPGLAFDVALHVGTLIALLWFFRRDWAALARSGSQVLRKRKAETVDEKRAVFIVLATVPAGLAGLLFADVVESALRAPPIIGCTLIVMGVLLWWADHVAPHGSLLSHMTWREALAIGVAQAFALIPGVSRSGSTITAARALGFDRSAAATFSFLLSFPITAAAAAAKVPEALHQGITPPIAVGVLAAAGSSAVAIAMLLRYVSRHSYGVFAVYRVIAGTAVLALWLVRR
ncbi:MAG: undecaprenyl-diphosphatase UppP [Gemmatimonadaceae bacterium]